MLTTPSSNVELNAVFAIMPEIWAYKDKVDNCVHRFAAYFDKVDKNKSVVLIVAMDGPIEKSICHIVYNLHEFSYKFILNKNFRMGCSCVEFYYVNKSPHYASRMAYRILPNFSEDRKSVISVAYENVEEATLQKIFAGCTPDALSSEWRLPAFIDSGV